MHISTAFPSEYLRAADLQGRRVTVKIDHVEMKDIGGDPKPILYFIGKEKGMVLNKTNANAIAAAFGDDTDDWQDAEVVLFEAMVDFQGKTVPAIRVQIPPRKSARREEPREERRHRGDDDDRGSAPVRPATGTDPNDEIPFSASFM